MKKILVLTDFSDHATHALEYACHFANHFNTEELIVLNTYEIIPLYDTGESASLSITLQQTEELESLRRTELQRMVENIGDRINPGIKVTTHLSNSNLVDAVNDICLSKKIDLVVMGIKVRGELEQVLLGSHVHRAIEKIDRPVLVVPVNAAITKPDKILLVTNFYESQNKLALKRLKEYLGKLKAPVVVVHKLLKKENRQETERLAAALIAELKEFNPQFNIIEDSNHLADNVNELAQQYEASLVISLHKKRGFFSRVFHKSTTKYLAWHSRVPVLVLHFE